MPTMYSKVSRLKEILRWCFEKYQPKCYFCKEFLDWKEFYRNMKGGGIDGFTEHHIDLHHYNHAIENREMSHRTCHRKYHKNLSYKERRRLESD